MAGKPTYQDMEDRVRRLEAELSARDAELQSHRADIRRYRLALEAVNEGLWDWNIRSGSVYFTPRYYTMLGYAPGELPATFETWRFLLHPDDVLPSFAKLNAYLEGRKPHFEIEFRLKTKSGAWKWILGKGEIVERDAYGNPIRMIGTHRDIHPRKQNEARTRRIHAVLRALRAAGPMIFREKSRERIIGGICELLVHDCGYPRAWVVIKEEGAETCIRAEAATGKKASVQSGLKPENVAGCMKIAEDSPKFVTMVCDASKCPECPACGNERKRKRVAMPLRRGDRPAGVLSFALPENLEVDPVEFDLVAGMAADISFRLYELDLEAKRVQIEKERRKFEIIFSTVRDPIFYMDSTMTVQAVNRAFLDFFGKERKDAIGRPLREILGRERYDRIYRRRIAACLAGGESRFQARFPSEEGGFRFLDIKLYPFSDSGGVDGVIMSSRDITSLKKTETSLIERTYELGERVKELNCLIGISMIMEKPGIGQDEIFRDVIQMVCAALQFPDIARARILLETGRTIGSGEEAVPERTVSNPIFAGNRLFGQIEIFYTERPPLHPESPFLTEEKLLLHSIAERLGKILERRLAETALQTSETRYRAMFENMSNGVAVFQPVEDGGDFIFVDFNKASERINRIRRDVVIGKSIRQLISETREADLIRHIRRVWETGEPRRYASRIFDGDQLTEWRENAIYRLDSGEIVLIYSDETRRRQAEFALKESEKRFRDLVESSPVGISIIQNHRVVYENSEQNRFHFYQGEAAFPTFDNLHPADVKRVREQYMETVSGKAGSTETDFRFYPYGNREGTGELIRVNCRMDAIKYMGADAVLVNMIDITRIREMERLLTIRDKMSSLGRVAAGIAHEIRNPLSGVNIYLDALEQMADTFEEPDKIRDILMRIQSASNKIESIIKRVMDFSKPGEPKFHRIDIRTPLEDAAHLTAVTLRKAGIEFRLESADSPVYCYADPHLIESVLLNLINNAMEAMRDAPGGRRIVSVELKAVSGSAHISVSDSGPGIPPDEVGNIFEPFYSTKNYGTGIGLSVCHRIVTDHGGTLDASVSRWGGAGFVIKLPLKPQET